MITGKQAARSEPPASDEVATTEAEIEATRRRLDLALTALRQELALPIAVVLAAAAILHRGAADAAQLRRFLQDNAVALGITALGAGWLAVQNGERIAELADSYRGELVETARSVGMRMIDAAVSAAIDEIGHAAEHVLGKHDGNGDRAMLATTAPERSPTDLRRQDT